MAFTALNDFILESEDSYHACTECRSAPPNGKGPWERYQYLPIIPRIKAMVWECRSCEQLYSYRRSRVTNSDVISDYFDGESYKELCQRYGVKRAWVTIFSSWLPQTASLHTGTETRIFGQLQLWTSTFHLICDMPLRMFYRYHFFPGLHSQRTCNHSYYCSCERWGEVQLAFWWDFMTTQSAW